MNIGQFVASEIIILLIINSVEKLITGLESFYDVLTSLEKLGQVVDKELEPQEGERLNGETTGVNIEWSEVGFQVEGKSVLRNISLEVPAGDRLLITGPSGSGRSSFLKLLAGIESPSSGHIYINQRDISSIQLNTYRSHLGMCLLEESPFEGSLKENLTFDNPDITSTDIMEMIDILGLKDFVKRLKYGLDTQIFPEGKQLSRSISRKIVLARALLKKPKVLLLQEPFEYCSVEEADRLIDYVTDPSHSWSIIVVSNNPYWKKKIKKEIALEHGTLRSVSNK